MNPLKKLNMSSQKFRLSAFIALFSLGFLMICASSPHETVYAQNISDTWSDPVNISGSGSTSSPKLVVDNQGTYHAVWLDKFNGYMYAEKTDNGKWEAPIQVRFPFTERDNSLNLISDDAGIIHALWRSSTGTLLYSQAPVDKFNQASAWITGRIVAESALSYSITIGSKGELYLAYVRDLSTNQFPSGIYFRMSSNHGLDWTDARIIYSSEYYRSMLANQAHVSISFSLYQDANVLNISWDNVAIKRIYLSRSTDSGVNWSDPVEMRGPASTGDFSYPFNVNLTSNAGNILYTWQIKDSNQNCTEYSQWSTNAGQNWSAPIPILENIPGCNLYENFRIDQKGHFILFNNYQFSTYLLAWNGEEWSQSFSAPLNFIDPYTSNTINLSNLVMDIDPSNRIVLIGNDINSGGDTWETDLPLTDIDNWFPSHNKWSRFGTIASNAEYRNLEILTDANNQYHALWLQSGLLTGSTSTTSIFYSTYKNGNWSSQVDLLGGISDNVISMDAKIFQDQIYLTWEDGTTDQVFFSLCALDRASIPSEWSSAKQITDNQIGGTSPRIQIDQRGSVLLTYLVPANDYKGIYFLMSSNEGATWSSPVKVSGIETDDWEMTTSVQIATDDQNRISLLWAKEPIIGENTSISLLSSYSLDDGQQWSTPETVIQGNIPWYLTLSAHQMMHRFWQTTDNFNVKSLWHQYSSDGGKTWNLPASYSGFELSRNDPAVSVDEQGSLLVFLAQTGTQVTHSISYYRWNDAGWVQSGQLHVNHFEDVSSSMAAAVTVSGNVLFSYTGPQGSDVTGRVGDAVYYLTQNALVPGGNPNQPAKATPTPTASPDQTPVEPSVVPTATEWVAQPTNAIENPVIPLQNSWLGLFIGLGAVFGFVIIILFIHFRRSK